MRRTFLVVLLVGAVACGSKTLSATLDSGIRGRVVAGPQCPVEQVGSPCPDKPVSTDLNVQDENGGVVAVAHSGEDGRFEVGLDPGTYVLEPARTPGTGFMFGKPVSVVVRAHRFASVTVVLDTGIR
jgi:hypothetical protein